MEGAWRSYACMQCTKVIRLNERKKDARRLARWLVCGPLILHARAPAVARRSRLARKRASSDRPTPCMDTWQAAAGERNLLSYDPTGGHTDQLRDFSLALAVARLLNRSLVVPRLYWHHDAVALTSQQERVRLGRLRPPLSALLDLSASGVPGVDDAELLVLARDLPRCADAVGPLNSTGRARADGTGKPHGARAVVGRSARRCVAWAEPPEAGHSVGALLRRLAAQNAPWVHFSSMRDVVSARTATPKRYPISAWESQLRPAACAVRYRSDVLAAAKRALEPVLPARDDYLAAHVRSLREGRGKSEVTSEWVARLEEFAASHQNPPQRAPQRALVLYLATDDLDTVVPIATSALRPWNVTIASARNLGRDLGPTGGRLMRTLDSSAALVALDVAAVLGASAFSPAPRSGLSVHYLAMRGCERIPGYQCNPAAAGCVPFASSGCGGAFPRLLLTGPPPCSAKPFAHKKRRPGDELCVDALGVERKYFCP